MFCDIPVDDIPYGIAEHLNLDFNREWFNTIQSLVASWLVHQMVLLRRCLAVLVTLSEKESSTSGGQNIFIQYLFWLFFQRR
jgi:hypothetical protein